MSRFSKKKKEAKFFCESCGSEVPGKAKVCPVCGKFFASVRCPKCGKTGTSEDFKKGCPACGYAVRPDELYGDFDEQNLKDYTGGDSSLPPWVYVITLVVLVILIICLYSCL